jgi:hypothetical protein
MKCSCADVERVLPEFLDGTPDEKWQDDVEAHVESCAACSDLVSDLQLIASEARQLAEAEEPSPRVWLRIAAELRAEGLIHSQAQESPEDEPASVRMRPVLVPSTPRRRWQAWWLAPIAAALLAAGAFVIGHKPVAQPVAETQTPIAPARAATPAPTVAPPVIAQTTVAPTPASQPAASQHPATQQLTQKPAQRPDVEPLASEEDQQFLSQVSTREPSMKATYESQLQALNANIREVQTYLDQNPGDEDARQQLMDAYRQKALLYQIAMDRIQ